MVSEVLFGTNERSEEGTARADSPKGQGEAGGGAIEIEPILLFHEVDDVADLIGEPVWMACQGVVDFRDKAREWTLGVIAPKVSEKVIKNDVDDDTGKASARGMQQIFGLEKHRMGIGEAID